MGSVIAICSAIVAITSIIVGLWKHFSRTAAYKRKMADEAKAKLDKANSPNGSASDFLDGFGNIH
jgi:hypothetical protein